MALTPISSGAGIADNKPPAWPKAALILPVWLAAVLFIIFAPLKEALGQRPAERAVLLIDIKGAIGFVAAEQLAKALKHAATQASPAVIVRLDTPGGLLSSTR